MYVDASETVSPLYVTHQRGSSTIDLVRIHSAELALCCFNTVSAHCNSANIHYQVEL